MRDLLELIGGTTFFLLSLVGCVIITNKITQVLVPNASRNIFLLCIHLIIIVAFVIALRSLFYKYIKNKAVLNSIFTLTGPIIGLSSLYMSESLNALINYYK